MSPQNIDLIRLGQEAFNAGDLGPVKPYMKPDLEWGAIGAFPGLADLYHGHDGIDEWMETVRSSFADFHASLERVLHDGGDEIAVVEHLRAVGRESGVEVEMRIFSVYSFADGKITGRLAFTNEDDALAAIGST